MKLIPQEKLNKALDKALLKHRPLKSEISLFNGYSAEGDHVIPWQTEHVFSWRTSTANAVSAFQS
jgi:hypothetical protein